MVDYGWPRVQYERNYQQIKQHFFLEFYIDPGGPGGHPRGSRTAPEAQKRPNIDFFNFIFFCKNRPKMKNTIFSNLPPGVGGPWGTILPSKN